MSKRRSPATERLLALIGILVDVVQENGGSMPVRAAERLAAQRAGVSVSEMPWVTVRMGCWCTRYVQACWHSL